MGGDLALGDRGSGAVVVSGGYGLADAEEALRLAQVEPERAQLLASDILAAVGPAGDGNEIGSVAERALGLAARELDDVADALSHFRRSVELAVSGGLPLRAAQARMSLSLTLLYDGESEEALREATLAEPDLPSADRARLMLQRALILQRLGRLEEALEGYRRALPRLRRTGNPADEARLLMNRGMAHTFRGDLRAAESDLRRSAELFEQLGLVLYAAKARHNLGFVAARKGDIPSALRWYDSAEADYRRLGVSRAIGLMDRCETLLSVRLVPEALATAEAAVKELEASGMKADLAQARLLLAQAVLLEGDAPRSAEIAALARDSFLEQDRPGWAAWARYAWLRAVWASGHRSPNSLELAAQVVDELLAAGWVGPAVDARLVTARIALGLGLVERAERELGSVSSARRSGPADLRARAWHAEALLRCARGDRRGADVALRAGLRVLARHQATLGATELRVYAARRGEELAALGTKLALEEGDAHRVLAWAERGRAAALTSRAALPPPDPEVADLLAELRHVVSLLENEGFAAHDTAPLLRRQAVLEAQIRHRTWCVASEEKSPLVAPPTASQLREALGDSVLVELLQVDGDLHAVTLRGRRATLHSLGPVAVVEDKVNRLRFALRRLASPVQSPSSGAADAFAEASHELDHLLLGPLAAQLGERGVVIVPAGACHALPWSSLPSLRGRSVSVAPSAALWVRAAADAGRAGRRTVLVAGPGLTHGDEEISQIARLYPRASTLIGAEATNAAVVDALKGADLVHIAAHGTFRGDNPLFSSLQLADGPLTVYDFEPLRRVPRLIVLSACEAGQSLIAGDELIGLSSALLCLGARTLIASMVPVSDEVTRPLMVEFHRGLLRHLSPAEALADAQVRVGGDTATGRARTSGFLCLGAG